VAARSQAAADPSEAGPGVLEHQLKTAQPLEADELPFTVTVDAGLTEGSKLKAEVSKVKAEVSKRLLSLVP
jgi:hypothetical protein